MLNFEIVFPNDDQPSRFKAINTQAAIEHARNHGGKGLTRITAQGAQMGKVIPIEEKENA